MWIGNSGTDGRRTVTFGGSCFVAPRLVKKVCWPNLDCSLSDNKIKGKYSKDPIIRTIKKRKFPFDKAISRESLCLEQCMKLGCSVGLGLNLLSAMSEGSNGFRASSERRASLPLYSSYF